MWHHAQPKGYAFEIQYKLKLATLMNGSGSPGVQKTALDSCLGSKVPQTMKRRCITGPSYSTAVFMNRWTGFQYLGVYEQDSAYHRDSCTRMFTANIYNVLHIHAYVCRYRYEVVKNWINKMCKIKVFMYLYTHIPCIHLHILKVEVCICYII